MRFVLSTLFVLCFSLKVFSQDGFIIKKVSELNPKETCLYENLVKVIKANIYYPDSTRFFPKIRIKYNLPKVTIRVLADAKSRDANGEYSDIVMDYGLDYELDKTDFNCVKRTWKITKYYFEGGFTRLVFADFELENEEFYDKVRYVYEDKALVKKDGLWGMVDRNGKYIIIPQYAYLKRHLLGLLAKKNGAFFFLSEVDGSRTSEKTYSIIRNSLKVGKDEYVYVAQKKGKYGLIGKNQTEITTFTYDQIKSLGRYIVSAKRNGGWILLTDSTGKELSKT